MDIGNSFKKRIARNQTKGKAVLRGFFNKLRCSVKSILIASFFLEKTLALVPSISLFSLMKAKFPF